MSNCLEERKTSANDAGVGSPSCTVPDCDGELDSLSSVLLLEAVWALFSPPLPANTKF